MPSSTYDRALARYRAAVRDACAAALDAGVFYQDDFTRFVRERTDPLDPAVDRFLGDFPISYAHDALPERAALSARIAQAPRGSWATHHYTSSDGTTRWRRFISDGTNTSCVGGSFDSYDQPPSYADVFGRMVSYEIYTARHAVAAERTRLAGSEALQDPRIHVGATYRDLVINRTRYSTAVVTAIDHDEGGVTLHLTRRGSRNRWTATVAARSLAAKLADAPPASASESATTQLQLSTP